MSESIYKAAHRHEGLPCVDGPGNGLGYYGHTLWPELTCENEVEAKRAASIANIAYEVAYKRAQYDIQRALGLSGS